MVVLLVLIGHASVPNVQAALRAAFPLTSQKFQNRCCPGTCGSIQKEGKKQNKTKKHTMQPAQETPQNYATYKHAQ